jgi:nucleotide-binding universal stress UspA family protein
MAKATTFRSRRILVHLDTTSTRRPALTRALHLAQSSGGSLRLVDVLVPLPRHTPNAATLEGLLRQEMKDRLADAAALAKRMGASVTTALLEGDVATMLVEASVSWRADVLLRSHGVHQSAPAPIGPTDSQLVRRCPCPVWFVTHRHAEGERVVVAAVDPDPNDGPRHLLSVRVVQAAIAVAEASGATLHVIHAWTAYGHQVLASHATPADLVDYVAACRDNATQRFAALLRDARVPEKVKTHLVEGQGDQVLIRFIEKRRADLVVLGTVGRTGLAGLVVGNTAERVLRQVRCSVLAFKPAGFAEAMVERRSD